MRKVAELLASLTWVACAIAQRNEQNSGLLNSCVILKEGIERYTLLHEEMVFLTVRKTILELLWGTEVTIMQLITAVCCQMTASLPANQRIGLSLGEKDIGGIISLLVTFPFW